MVEHARYELTSVIRDARQRVFSASLALHQTVYIYIYTFILHIYSITSPTSRLNPLDPAHERSSRTLMHKYRFQRIHPIYRIYRSEVTLYYPNAKRVIARELFFQAQKFTLKYHHPPSPSIFANGSRIFEKFLVNIPKISQRIVLCALRDARSVDRLAGRSVSRARTCVIPLLPV